MGPTGPSGWGQMKVILRENSLYEHRRRGAESVRELPLLNQRINHLGKWVMLIRPYFSKKDR